MSVFVVAALLAGSAEAQQANDNAGGNGTGTGAGTGTGMGNLSISEGFQVERTGTVGESTSTPVGANAASAAAQSTGGATAGRSGGLGGFGGGGGGLGAAFGNLFGNSNSQSSNNSTPPIRTRLRAAVDLAPSIGTNPTISGVTATSRLRQSSTLQPGGVYGGVSGGRYNGVAIQMQGRTAVLTGQVRTEADRRMSHLMMRLEPGVSEVQNRIELSPGR